MYFVMDNRSLPQVRLADRTRIEPPHVHKKRVPHEYILYVVQKGEMYLYEDGHLYPLSQGDFILLSPESFHEGRRATCCEYFYVHFQHPHMELLDGSSDGMKEEMRKIRSATLRSDACRPPDESGSRLILPKYGHIQDEGTYEMVSQLLRDTIRMNREHLESYKALCGCQLLQVLIRLSRQYLSAELQKAGLITTRSYKKVLAVQSYLHACYREPITGDGLEEKFDINFDYLNRLFRQNIGKPVFRYLNELRIAHARELIRTTSMRITQISEQVGFADESYFSKVFKKYTGVSPADYARML